MKLLFIHGWSVTNTDTYGDLPEAIQSNVPADFNLDIRHIFLGRYISFHDEVKVDDIARAFNKARLDAIGDEKFSCITHSTGGPVIREWIDQFYGAGNLAQLPLTHLIMLAPANHGSALAQLGKARLSRMKSWFEGVEPGQGVLNWLELGSSEQRRLNMKWLKYVYRNTGFFPFVITGESIDKKLYDYLNSYTGEKGSDGVVRACSTNMNYSYVQLTQNTSVPLVKVVLDGRTVKAHPIEIADDSLKDSPPCAFEVIPGTSHSGKKMGIMRCVTVENGASKPVVGSIVSALKVKTYDEFTALAHAMSKNTAITQSREGSVKGSMLVFRVYDDRDNNITDFDMYLLATEKYSPENLPKGFFIDRQKNSVNRNQLTYFLNTNEMHKIGDKKVGFLIVARPDKGFSYYSPAVFKSGDFNLTVEDILKPNQTMLIDIKIKRHVDKEVCRLDKLKDGKKSFKKTTPSGQEV